MSSPPQARRLSGGRLALARLAVLVFSLLVALIGAELVVRQSGRDRTEVASSLYFQVSDLAVHQVSEDPYLHYELRPESRLADAIGFEPSDPRRDGYDPGGLDSNGRRSYEVYINALGARGQAPAEAGPGGSFRIHFHGASTVYGAGVDDDETIPWYLEEVLRERLGAEAPRVDVLNFGTSGTVVSQQARLARRELERHEPDLVLLMRTNIGRRPFLGDEGFLERDYSRWFAADPIMWMENFPPDPDGPFSSGSRMKREDYRFPRSYPPLPGLPEWAWQWGLRRSALFRVLVLPGVRERYDQGHFPYAEFYSQLEARALDAAAREAGTEVIWIGGPGEFPTDAADFYPGASPGAFIDLAAPEGDALEQESHPPPWMLRVHAVAIADYLEQSGRLPGG